MKILMMSKEGDGLAIAAKLQEEGHEVRVWLPEEDFEFALLGVVDRSSSWRKDASDWADLVVSDMVGFGDKEQVLQGFEVLYLGFNQMADVLELKRHRQIQAFRKFGVSMPETFSFETPEHAKDLFGLWTSTVKGFVLKPSGNIETGRTYVLKDKRLLDWALDQYSGDQELVAQRYVEGVEISTQGWFNGMTWLEPFDHTMEEKRFLTGDIGPNTGCMGNTVWPIAKSDRDRFVQELKKLTSLFKAMNYKGPVDLNCIANSEGIWALELTVRFGYDAIEAWYGLLNEPLAMVLMELAMGTKGNIDLKDEFSTAVRLSVPPYPHDKPSKLDRGLPILNVAPERPNQFLTDVFWENNMARWSAADGVLLKVTGSGKTPKVSRRAAYQGVKEIRTQGLQFRTDIGERVEGDMKKLKSWRYI